MKPKKPTLPDPERLCLLRLLAGDRGAMYPIVLRFRYRCVGGNQAIWRN